ncbi:MAG TPA: chemotaxis protein CheW [Geobacteraceae bacterium]
MNLAELRKKAQQEKREYVVDRPVVSPEELPSVDEALEMASLQTRPDEEVAFPPMPEELEPVSIGVASPVAATGRGVPDTFNPLAVLLAGRESALGDEPEPEDGAAVEAAGEQLQEFLCFRVSSEIYAINIMDIKEIIKPREVTEVPRAPAFVSGVLSLRGIIIPIFNMRLRLGLPVVEKSARERIIVLKKSEDFFGILVDEVIQVVRIAATSIEKPPAVLDDIDRDFVSGIGRFDGQMLIVLNQEKILDLTIG